MLPEPAEGAERVEDAQAWVLLPDAIRPGWHAPPGIAALMSTRAGGVSSAPFDSLNLRPPALPGDALDSPEAVHENQRRFAAALGAAPVWLNQVHGADVVRLTAADLQPGLALPRADASISTQPGVACTVLVADCLPVLFCSADGRAVGAAHAGWRGLAGGVLDNTVAALCQAAVCRPDQLLAWLGPCIGPQAFEVGPDVLLAFGADPLSPDPTIFRFSPRADGSPRWRANLPGLARQRLTSLGLQQITGGLWCTAENKSQFFSFRVNNLTGRMAAAVAIRS